MSTSSANDKTKRWNIEAISLDELNLLTLSFEATAAPSFEGCFISRCPRRHSGNRCRLR